MICIGRPSSTESCSPISNVAMTRSPSCSSAPTIRPSAERRARPGTDGPPSVPGRRYGYCSVVDVEAAVRVDLERQVLPAVDDVPRGLREHLVDLLAAEVRELLVHEGVGLQLGDGRRA